MNEEFIYPKDEPISTSEKILKKRDPVDLTINFDIMAGPGLKCINFICCEEKITFTKEELKLLLLKIKGK